jgi:hypothetical protein
MKGIHHESQLHAGQSSLFRLPEKRKRVLQAAVPDDDTGSDDVLWALVEADWVMIDGVLGCFVREGDPNRDGVRARPD